MTDATDDDNMPWTGRPQDDPILHAALERRLADFRREHPPVNCWIDKVRTIELVLNGVRRALVDRDRALILFYDGQGAPASSVVYLRSENPYDVAEAHLGVERVAEVRDESIDADEILSDAPRAQEERETLSFKSRHYRDVDIFHYLRSAVKLLQHESGGTGGSAPIIEMLLQAIGAEVQDRHPQALAFVQNAAAALEGRDGALMFGEPALADCRRAIVALERLIALQSRQPLRFTIDGKSGG